MLLDGSDSNTASIALSYVEGLVQNYPLQVRSQWAGPARRPAAGSSRGCARAHLVQQHARIHQLHRARTDRRHDDGDRRAADFAHHGPRVGDGHHGATAFHSRARRRKSCWARCWRIFVVGLADTTIAVLVGIFVYGVPFRGNVLMLALEHAAVPVRRLLLGHSGFGRWPVRSCSRFRWDWSPPSCRRSCCPDLFMPSRTCRCPSRSITHVVPARYFVTIVRGIFLKGIGSGDVMGTSSVSAGCFSALVFWAAERKMRQKLA